MITIDVDRAQRKVPMSPISKFGLNVSKSTADELPSHLKYNGMMPIPIDLFSRNGLAYSGPVYLGGT